MATIVINGVTFREACLAGSNVDDAPLFDAEFDSVMSVIKARAEALGIGFTVDPQGQGAASYRVTDETGQADHDAAHEFMQSDAADFWHNCCAGIPTDQLPD